MPTEEKQRVKLNKNIWKNTFDIETESLLVVNVLLNSVF